jgi:ech hydrogenase subunit D
MQNVTPVTIAELKTACQAAKAEGCRLVTLSCAELDAETVDIIYHFDKDLSLKNYRLTAKKCEPVPSISDIYFAALLVENEIQDLFGLSFSGLVVDYKQTLYLEAEVRKTPFCKYSVAIANKA